MEAKEQANAPKVLFAESVTASHTSILIFDLAKLIRQNGVDIGGNRLFQWMRDNGYLIKRKGTDYNMPTQKAMEMGLFEVKETAVTHSDGHTTVNRTPKVTGRGRVIVLSLLIVAGCLVCGAVCMVLGVSRVGLAVCQQGMVAGSLLPLVKLVPVILPVISLSRVNLQVSWVRLNLSERKA